MLNNQKSYHELQLAFGPLVSVRAQQIFALLAEAYRLNELYRTDAVKLGANMASTAQRLAELQDEAGSMIFRLAKAALDSFVPTPTSSHRDLSLEAVLRQQKLLA